MFHFICRRTSQHTVGCISKFCWCIWRHCILNAFFFFYISIPKISIHFILQGALQLKICHIHSGHVSMSFHILCFECGTVYFTSVSNNERDARICEVGDLHFRNQGTMVAIVTYTNTFLGIICIYRISINVCVCKREQYSDNCVNHFWIFKSILTLFPNFRCFVKLHWKLTLRTSLCQGSLEHSDPQYRTLIFTVCVDCTFSLFLILEWRWGLNLNCCPRERGFKFSVPLQTFMTVWCTWTGIEGLTET